MPTQRSVFLALIVLVTVGCGSGPKFNTVGRRVHLKDDGRGVILWRVVGQEENMLGAIITHQSTACIPSDEIGKTRPSQVFKLKSSYATNIRLVSSKIDRCSFKVDGEEQKFGDGIWIYYLTDVAKYKKIRVPEDKADELKDDLMFMDLFEVVDKWCATGK